MDPDDPDDSGDPVNVATDTQEVSRPRREREQQAHQSDHEHRLNHGRRNLERLHHRHRSPGQKPVGGGGRVPTEVQRHHRGGPQAGTLQQILLGVPGLPAAHCADPVQRQHQGSVVPRRPLLVRTLVLDRTRYLLVSPGGLGQLRLQQSSRGAGHCDPQWAPPPLHVDPHWVQQVLPDHFHRRSSVWSAWNRRRPPSGTYPDSNENGPAHQHSHQQLHGHVDCSRDRHSVRPDGRHRHGLGHRTRSAQRCEQHSRQPGNRLSASEVGTRKSTRYNSYCSTLFEFSQFTSHYLVEDGPIRELRS